MKMFVSAIVVVFNEVRYLEKCFKGLAFCDEIIVIDLGSIQPVVDICKKYATHFLTHERVDIVEKIREWACRYAKYKWVLFVDPDEVLGDGVSTSIQEVISSRKLQDVSCVSFRFLYYFKGKPLKGTFWSGNSKIMLLNTDSTEILDNVHAGYRSKNNGITLLFENDENIIHHYWADSWEELFEKHRRYLKHEGGARHRLGMRYPGLIKQIKETWEAFFLSFMSKKGFRDGYHGLLLSIFYAWYVFMAANSHRLYEKRLQRDAL